MISSCSKDDNKAAALEGKWEFAKIGSMVGTSEFLIDFPHTPGCDKDYQEFLAGGVFRGFTFDNTGSGCETFQDNGTWTRSGNMITITIDGENEQGEIMSLTGSTLKVKSNIIDEEDGSTQIVIIEFVRR